MKEVKRLKVSFKNEDLLGDLYTLPHADELFGCKTNGEPFFSIPCKYCRIYKPDIKDVNGGIISYGSICVGCRQWAEEGDEVALYDDGFFDVVHNSKKKKRK